MKRVLFLIHDLGPGGAEKVLVNLVNAMDRQQFEVSVKTLFDWGANRQFLSSDVHYSCWMPMDIPANSHWMKLWTPRQLWKMIIPEGYDIVVSFLEGPCARVVGGCPENGPETVIWIHTPILNKEKFSEGFRDQGEAERCYRRADAVAFVSDDVRDAFCRWIVPEKRSGVLYNIFDSGKIRELSLEDPVSPSMDPEKLNWCGLGKLIPLKGWTRMLHIQRKLLDEGFPAHFYVIGDGPQRNELIDLADRLGIRDSVTFTGYQTNPYQYLSRCMLYVCASDREGLSTAVIESLTLGTPVCTTDVGGMKEILGCRGEYGIVTPNDDTALYTEVRRFFAEPEHRLRYAKLALERGKDFDRERAVRRVEEFILGSSV